MTTQRQYLEGVDLIRGDILFRYLDVRALVESLTDDGDHLQTQTELPAL